MLPRRPRFTLFPYTTLFRSPVISSRARCRRPRGPRHELHREPARIDQSHAAAEAARSRQGPRSEEHTSELQSQSNLVCRLLLEKKKKPTDNPPLTQTPTSSP